MDSYGGSKHAADEPVASSSGTEKRPRAAGADPDQPPQKRQRQQNRPKPFDLDQLTIACAVGSHYSTTALNILADPGLTRGELRNAHHYRYDEFRTWLLETADIPRERVLQLVLSNLEGRQRNYLIRDRWSFADVLGAVRNGICTVPFFYDYGYVLRFQPDAPPRVALPIEAATAEVQSLPRDSLPDSTPQPWVELGAVEGEGVVTEKGASALTDDVGDQPGATADPIASIPHYVDLTAIEDGAAVVGEENGALANTDTSLTSFGASVVARALRFFQVAESSDGKYTIKGIKRRVHMYQLYTTYGLFMSPITSGVNGALVGWGVGFGKTMLVLLYLDVRARLAGLWAEVEAEWEGNSTTRRQHLPRKGQQHGARCPSQHKHVVECPCVASSDSRRICEAYLTNSPALVVIPSGLAHNWLDEKNRLYAGVRDKPKGTKSLEIYSYVSGLKDNTNVNGRPERLKAVVKNTSGEVYDDEDEEMKTFVTSGEGEATDIFLVSAKSVARLYEKYPLAEGTGIRCFTAGVVIMDEHHQYKGGAESTIPFTVLREISKRADHPVTLFTLCGTTLEEGPSAWRAAIEHFDRQWQSFQQSGILRCPDKGRFLATAARFTEARRQYLGLIRVLGDRTTTAEEIGPEIRELVDFFKPVMWSLQQGQRYRGKMINPLPPCREEYNQLDPVMDTDTSRAFKNLVTGVQALVDRLRKKLKAEWDKSDKADPMPTMASTIASLVSGEQRPPNTSFSKLQRASMYPHIAVLQDSLDPEVFKAESCQVAAHNCQKRLLDGEAFDTAWQELSRWDLTPHLDALERNSAKFGYVKRLISQMVADQDGETAPPDGSGKRHAILFHTQTISAVLTYVLLSRDRALRGVVKPLLLSSRCNNEERAAIVDEMNKRCTAESPNKVLVAVTSIAAEGFNIQRANNIWFPELPPTLSKKQQATGRSYRQGQLMNVNVVKLAENGNLMEELGFDAMRAKETVARLVYGLPPVP